MVTYIVYGIYCHMRNSVTYLGLRVNMLGDTNDQYLASLVSSHDTWCSSVLTIYLGISMFNYVMRCMRMFHNGL